MKVQVLIVTYPFEFSKVLGVYRGLAAAEAHREEAIKKDESKGYNEFDIEEWEVAL